MRVVATRIEPDGTMHRRMVDTARQSDRRLWEDLAARAIEVPVPYRPALGIAIYHISVDDYVVMAAEYDLAGVAARPGDCRDGTGWRSGPGAGLGQRRRSPLRSCEAAWFKCAFVGQA
jgi:hypothetical protein